jgi:hypothetical protein
MPRRGQSEPVDRCRGDHDPSDGRRYVLVVPVEM